MKHAYFVMDQQWSWWAESMQKDVECTFGIIKAQLRVLKFPIHSCALHTWLLEINRRNDE